MADRVEKQRLMALLRRAGLWAEADQYREAARQRLRAEGKTKQEAVASAWREMADKYEPLVEQSFQTILPQGAKCFDDLVDRDYTQANDAVQMRDVYRWLKDEFPRIVEDRPGSTVVDYRRLETPPPTGLACNILETWAAKPPAGRDGLYREIRRYLGTVPVPEPEAPMPEDDDGFFDTLSIDD
jgi:hypothetical protein